MESLRAETKDDQIVVTPLLKNSGNSVVRPLTSLKVTDSAGVSVAELPQKESLPLLGGAELVQPLVVESRLAPGTYTVKYRVDFQDGSRPTEGVTELVSSKVMTQFQLRRNETLIEPSTAGLAGSNE